MSYYNTTKEKNQDLSDLIQRAKNQDELILNIFIESNKTELSASDVFRLMQFKYPLTSVRRSINTLMNGGHLQKTENKKIGIYGRKEYLFKL